MATRPRPPHPLRTWLAVGWLIALPLPLSSCFSDSPTAVERAVYRHWVHQPGHHDIGGASCDQRGHPFHGPTRTVTAYLCKLTGGGRNDQQDFRVFWDGSKVVPEGQLSDAESNALMFD
jgi:hypothetical protein